jgi:hypothetical protein
VKTYTLFLIGCLFPAFLTSCATAAQETPLPSTTTPVLATYTPEPTSCEEVEGICLELSFEGESCTYEGPTDLKPGLVTLIFLNESDDWAGTNLMMPLGDKTLQDMLDYFGEVPSQQHAPSWSFSVPGVWREIRAGESHFWEGALEPGNHVLACARTLPWPEPIAVWIGTVLTVGY